MFKMMAFSLDTCTQPGTPLINEFVDHALLNRRRNGDTSFTPLWDIARQKWVDRRFIKKYDCDLWL